MTSLGQAQVAAQPLPHAHHGAPSRRRFLGHFIEMQVAMMVGMAAGGALGVSAIAGTELRAAAWMIAMVVPMVAWMRFRGMSWRASAEMSAAMLVPTLAALPIFWAGLIPGSLLIGIEHMSMGPAMLALMVYRRREYGWPVG